MKTYQGTGMVNNCNEAARINIRTFHPYKYTLLAMIQTSQRHPSYPNELQSHCNFHQQKQVSTKEHNESGRTSPFRAIAIMSHNNTLLTALCKLSISNYFSTSMYICMNQAVEMTCVSYISHF